MDERARHERLKALYSELSQLPPNEQENALHRIRSEDPDLVAEIHALLAQATRPELLEGHAAAALTDATVHLETRASRERPRQLGPYLLLEQIGSGGMGIVYRAEQLKPIRREVAVKVLRGGMRRELLMARFEAERRAMALTDHPGVARILDAGEESGTSYLVMELVRGEPLTTFIRNGRRPVREALPLFISACRVVQHAHQKGIIHRDLKPANILLTEVDGEPFPKVIDFGIARITGDADSGVTITGAGQVLGTLEYMSPEQASGRSRDVDTRSDVYSLGAVLYEILTGAVPHDLRDKSYAEAIDWIRRNPPRPFRHTQSAQKQSDPDLETITRKALELEPSRRYDGPGALADDLQRYLRMEPIVARPPSTAYQVRKLFQRHRGWVASVATVALLLLIFGVAMSFLYAEQLRERERAEGEAAKAGEANRFLREMIGAATPDRLGKDVTVRGALDQSLEALKRRSGLHPDVLATVQHAMGTAYLELGEPVRADSLLRLAWELQVRLHGERDPASTEILLALASTAANRHNQRAADSLAERAIHLVPPASPHAEERLALAYRIRGEVRTFDSPALGDSLLQHALAHAHRAYGPKSAEVAETQALLGWAKAQRGEMQEGTVLLRAAAEALQDILGPSHSKTVAAFGNLSQIVPPEEAISIRTRLLEGCLRTFGPDHPATGDRQNDVAVAYMTLQRYEEAERLQRAAIQTWTRAFGPIHHNIAVGYNNLAFVQHCQGELDSAAVVYIRARDVMRLAEPGSYHTVTIRRNLALVRIDQGRMGEALSLLRMLHADIVSGTGLEPKSREAADFLGTLATAHWVAGNADSAVAWSRIGLSEYTRLGMTDNPAASVLRCVLGLALFDSGERGEADSILRTEGRRVVEGQAWPPDKRRVLSGLERHYRNRGMETEAGYYREARLAMPGGSPTSAGRS